MIDLLQQFGIDVFAGLQADANLRGKS